MTAKKPTELQSKLDALMRFKCDLLGSYSKFLRYFFYQRHGKRFEFSDPEGRESHHITIAKALTQVFDGKIKRLIINIPPRYGKTEMVVNWMAWCLARYPDCQFLYVSYGADLATRYTGEVRDIITHEKFKRLFGVKLRDDTKSKSDFKTTAQGRVFGVGAEGGITGTGAGLKNVNRFGGAIVIDDIIKPGDAASETIRESANKWYMNTLRSRLNSMDTPIVFIGQRTHEDDLAGRLLSVSAKTGRSRFDGERWDQVVLPALDEHCNPLWPQFQCRSVLTNLQETAPYEFAAQYQQNPQPAGGGLFKSEWFLCLEEEPKIEAVFITVDTAETSKRHNDATVFSFWGVYRAPQDNTVLCLHWLDCEENWWEPKDLQAAFLDFYTRCRAVWNQDTPIPAYIEKKSTGVTLVSVLNELQGVTVIPIERDRTSKTARFLASQPFIANKQVTLPLHAAHTKRCIEHMSKITANEMHRCDDIADTCADAIRLALKEKQLVSTTSINTMCLGGHAQELPAF